MHSFHEFKLDLDEPEAPALSPPQSRQARLAQATTLALEMKMNTIGAELESLIRPPSRPRIVFGGAQQVERGSLRPPPPPPPPKVYNSGPTLPPRRAASPVALSPSVPPAGARAHPSRARAYGLATAPIDQRSSAVYRSLNLEERSLMRYGSPTAPHTTADGVLIRDGLTPGQRALGMSGNSAPHAATRALLIAYPSSPCLMPSLKPPMGQDKRRFAASRKAATALERSRHVERARRRAAASGWLMTDGERERHLAAQQKQQRAARDAMAPTRVGPPGAHAEAATADVLPPAPGEEHGSIHLDASRPYSPPSPSDGGSLSRPYSPSALSGGPSRPYTPGSPGGLSSSSSSHNLRRAQSASRLSSPALHAYRTAEGEQLAARYSYFPLTYEGLAPERTGEVSARIRM